MAQRISRAKQTIARPGSTSACRPGRSGPNGCAPCCTCSTSSSTRVTATSDGDALTVPALSQEAIRLTRWLHRLLPDDGEVAGLLALMLLTDARRPPVLGRTGRWCRWPSRTGPEWDQAQIAEGIALITAALPRGEAGPYQLQAAIAAVHDEATTMADTDWPQILALYGLLEALRRTRSPRSTARWPWPWCTGRGRARVLAALAADKRMARHHRLLATRAHLRELAGHTRRRPPITSRRRGTRPACPNAATWRFRPRASAGRHRPGRSDFRREEARRLCAMMQEITSEPPAMWGSSIIGFGSYHYRYASGHEGDSALASFSPRRQHLAIYLVGEFEDRDHSVLARLGPHRAGKGCLYIKRLGDVDHDALRELIDRSVRVRKGVDRASR